MSVHHTQKRRAAGFSVETLEGRALLTTLAGAHLAHAAELGSVHADRVVARSYLAQGQVTGQLTAAVGSSAGNAHFMASGTLRKGPGSPAALSFAGDLTVGVSGRKISISNGLGTLVVGDTVNGSSIVVNLAGSGRVARGNIQTVPVSGTIQSGTGIYAGALGRFTGTAKINALTQTFTLSVTLHYKVLKTV